MADKKRHKALKITGAVIIIILAIGAGLYLYLTSHTQILVGFIQRAMYGDGSPNSFEPL